MGIKCPKCKSTNTKADYPGKMVCYNCSHSWKPYKHRGKKTKIIGDGILTPRKRIVPGAKTTKVGDGILTPIKRVKKSSLKRKPIKISDLI